MPHEVISPPTEFIANRKVNTFRTTESVTQQHCQFTKQGINRACYSRGTICSRSAISEDTSCCREQMRGSERGSPEPMRHSCHGCDTEEVGCCGDYETCVSCCLRPDHIAQHISRTYIPSEVGFPSVILAALSNNDFEWCEYVCRTSSRSLLAAENSYSSSHVRHCYRLDSHAPNDQTGVNSDRASVCLKSQPGDASHHKRRRKLPYHTDTAPSQSCAPRLRIDVLVLENLRRDMRDYFLLIFFNVNISSK